MCYEILWEEMYIRNQAFWDVTLCFGVNVSRRFERGNAFIFMNQAANVNETPFRGTSTLAY